MRATSIDDLVQLPEALALQKHFDAKNFSRLRWLLLLVAAMALAGLAVAAAARVSALRVAFYVVNLGAVLGFIAVYREQFFERYFRQILVAYFFVQMSLPELWTVALGRGLVAADGRPLPAGADGVPATPARAPGALTRAGRQRATRRTCSKAPRSFITWLAAVVVGDLASPEMLAELAYRLAVSERLDIKSVRESRSPITPLAEPDAYDRGRLVPAQRTSAAACRWDELREILLPPYSGHYGGVGWAAAGDTGFGLASTRAVAAAFFGYHPQLLQALGASAPLLSCWRSAGRRGRGGRISWPRSAGAAAEPGRRGRSRGRARRGGGGKAGWLRHAGGSCGPRRWGVPTGRRPRGPAAAPRRVS